MERVLFLPELLEAILLHVDMTTLLVSVSRVNRSWNAVVSTSPALQQALYFRPVPSDGQGEVLWDPMSETEDITRPALNPLLVAKFGSCFFDFGPTYGYGRRAESFYTMPWTRKHHRTIKMDYAPNCVGPTLFRVESPVTSCARDVLKAVVDRQRFTRRGASWRRMLVSQPPPPLLGYLWWEARDVFSGPETMYTALVSSGTGDGVRMGELYDLVQYHAGHHETNSLLFRVAWGQPQQFSETLMHQHHCERLLSQTGLLVDLRPRADEVWAYHPLDPPDVRVFDSTFRCEEYSKPNIEPQEIRPQGYIRTQEGHFNYVYSSINPPLRRTGYNLWDEDNQRYIYVED
ncbi:hypothetical protein TOPH_01116 [Tolypocladium ophioglossoides CBS 100239]|uniref:F-box domain-containing protein n=1 Tax=Tolypocladium ophioglossoides (strain CBS 100239) TaxID=1163406 RepID=A0A0L0NJ48_TOLOC|nr:hypothetical protein TOPH_01116 [Tolypocladium ophioglossoides CBS 100239]